MALGVRGDRVPTADALPAGAQVVPGAGPAGPVDGARDHAAPARRVAASDRIAEPGASRADPAADRRRAIVYEETFQGRPGAQGSGSVAWSLVNQPAADGLPAEPAIRAVADVPAMKLRLTLTIRRNADPTLPATHLLQFTFTRLPGFAGGQVAEVVGVAFKPTEPARGAWLVGMPGRMAEDVFVIALNDVPEVRRSNLALMSGQPWLDIAIRYGTGQRALVTLEKGPAGDRAFREALKAWDLP